MIFNWNALTYLRQTLRTKVASDAYITSPLSGLTMKSCWSVVQLVGRPHGEQFNTFMDRQVLMDGDLHTNYKYLLKSNNYKLFYIIYSLSILVVLKNIYVCKNDSEEKSSHREAL